MKRQLRQFAEERRNAPRNQVTAEFRELMEYLQSQAGELGVDALRGLEKLRDAAVRDVAVRADD